MPTDDLRADATSALIRHLTGRQRAGEEHVWLTEEARRDLATLRNQSLTAPRTKADPGAAGKKAPSQPSSAETPAPCSTNPPSEFTRIREQWERDEDRPRPKRQISPATTRPKKPAPARSITPAIATGTTKREKLDSLIAQTADCGRCNEIGTFRETMVFSTGDPDADFMFVGEAPGAEEEAKAEPFVGPAGQLLTKIIGAMGLDRSKVYISNICKYRPRLPNQTSNNRKPTDEEMEACLPYILAEVEIVRPRVIVALGGTAMEGLLGVSMSVARARDSIHDFGGVPLIVTYHPSYLLRNTALSERRKVWEDMMKGMELVGLPISEKQRTFFRGRG